MSTATPTQQLVEIPDRVQTLQRARLVVDQGLLPGTFLQNLSAKDARDSRPFLASEHEFLRSDRLVNEIIRPDPHWKERRKYQLAHDLITLGIIRMSDLLEHIQNGTFAHPIRGYHDIKCPIAGWTGFFDGESLSSIRGVESIDEWHPSMLYGFRRFDASRGPDPCKMFFFLFPEKLDRDGTRVDCMITTHHQ